MWHIQKTVIIYSGLLIFHLAWKITAKFPWNQPFFPRICSWKSREIWLFSRDLPEALYISSPPPPQRSFLILVRAPLWNVPVSVLIAIESFNVFVWAMCNISWSVSHPTFWSTKSRILLFSCVSVTQVSSRILSPTTRDHFRAMFVWFSYPEKTWRSTGSPHKQRICLCLKYKEMYGRILKSLNIINLYQGMSKLKLKINVEVSQLLCIVVSVALNGEFERFGRFCVDCYYTLKPTTPH